MPYAPQGIAVEPNGQTVVVTITEQGGGTPTVYTDRNAQTALPMPATITTRTIFYLTDLATFTVSAKVGGVENANGNAGTQVIDLTGGGFGSISVPVPVNTAGVDSAIYLTQTSASGTYLKVRRPVTFMCIGDSITANGGGNIVSGVQNFNYQPFSYVLWAQILSSSRILHKGNAATAGYTIQNMRDNWLPTVIAAKPTYCVVLAGQNSLNDLAGYGALCDSLIAAGIIPICATIPATTTLLALYQMNGYIKRYARKNGLPLVDFHSVTVDQTTGVYKTGYSGDGTHPLEPAAKAMGQALANVFTQIAPVNVIASMLADTNSQPDVTLPNPLFLAAINGGNNGTTSWNAGTAGVATLTTDAACLGQKFTITRQASGDYFEASTAIPVTVGNTLLIAFRLGAVVEAVAGQWGVGQQDNSNGLNLFSTGSCAKDVPFGSIIAYEYTVPAGLPSGNQRFQLQALAATNAALSIAQFTWLDLTALGYV